MTAALPPFLAELGIVDLDPALDERALRRAYARRLKQIDIEAEPQRFQVLREALEAALRWSAAGQQPVHWAGAAPPAPSEPLAMAAIAPDDADTLATAAFASFQPQVTTFLDHSLAQDAVQQALADARLAPIDARSLFEWRIARLLADGWQRGHDHLLGAAIEAFGWDTDHTRLGAFGQVGAVLAAAIRDIAIAQGFTEAQRVAIAPLLQRLRAGDPPDAATLGDDIAALQFLVQRVPNWLRMVAPAEPVDARFQMWRDRPATPPQRPSTGKKRNSRAGIAYMVGVAVVMVLILFAVATQEPAPHHRPPVLTELDEARIRALEQRQAQVEALLNSIRQPPSAPAARPRNTDNPASGSPASSAQDSLAGSAPPVRDIR